MSTFTVNVTSAGAANVAVSNSSTVNATVGNGGAVNVAVGGITPGNATVVSGTLTINSTTTLNAGTPAYAKNVGTVYAAKLDLGIPAGPYTTIAVGNTTTLTAGSNATVNGTQDGGNLTLAFGIPRGADGTTPTVTVGNVTTGAPGSTATVTATTSNNGANLTLNFTIPRGDPGTDGANGTTVTLSSATPANLGTSAAGTSNLVSRADHVHALPVIAYANLSGVPSNFPTNTTLVSGLNTSYSAINHAHNYVTSLNNLTGALTLAAGGNVTLAANGSTLTVSASAGIGPNDAIDGGNFVGEIVASITFLNQPQSTVVNLGQTLNWTSGSNTSRYLLQLGNNALGLQLTSNGSVANIATYSNLATTPSATTTENLSVTGTNATVSLASNGTRSLIQVFRNTSNGSWESATLLSDDGSTWSALNVPRPSKCLAAGPLGFVGDAYDDDAVALQSSDGQSWNTRTLPFEPSPGGFAYSQWRFAVGPTAMIGVCGDTYRCVRSTTGAAWSSVNLSTGANLALSTNVAYGGGRFVTIGSVSGNGVSYSSVDGLSWTRSTMPNGGYDSIWHLGGRFVALRSGEQSTDAAVSADGVTWALQSLPVTDRWRSAAYAGGNYGVTSYDGLSAAPFAIGAEPTAGSANLTVSAVASTGATVGYQWQRSLDGGATFNNVANATTQTLSLTNVTIADSGTRYRVLATATGVPSATSSSALLTVN